MYDIYIRMTDGVTATSFFQSSQPVIHPLSPEIQSTGRLLEKEACWRMRLSLRGLIGTTNGSLLGKAECRGERGQTRKDPGSTSATKSSNVTCHIELAKSFESIR